MVASSNFTINQPVAPASGNRAGSNFSLTNPVFPLAGNRASSSFSLLIDFNTDAENTFTFTQDAASMIASPMDIFANAGVNVQFSTTNAVDLPAQLATADNTVAFDSQGSEDAIFASSGLSNVEFNGVASEIAELNIGAENVIQVSSTVNSTVVAEAETFIEFSAISNIPPEIDIDKIILHGAEFHQANNTMGPQGGAVECTRKMAIGPVPASLPISLIGTNSSDVGQVYIIEGLGLSRVIEREAVMLNGVNQVSTERSFTRLYKVTKEPGQPLMGDVIISAGTSVIGVMDAMSGVETTEIVSFLTNAMGRATVDTAFYEKFFIKNSTGQEIGKMTVSEHQSDFKERALFAADPSYNDNSTSRNRLTKPGAVNPGDFLTDSALCFTHIPHGTAVGIWLRLIIPAGEGTVLNGWKIKIVADEATKIYDLLHPEGSGLALATTLVNRDLHPIGGGNPTQYIELAGGKLVRQSYYEPDPITFRDQFYYNARQNRLFKKLNSKPTPVWKIVR